MLFRSLQKVLLYLQPLFHNPPRKLPNSLTLRGGWGYYAVQGHPRSPSLVPIESSYATSYSDRKMEIVSSYSHLGDVISSRDGDSLDIMKQKRAFNGQVNTLFLVNFRPWSNHVCSLRIVRTSTEYGCELWGLTCVQLLDFCTARRKGVHTV